MTKDLGVYDEIQPGRSYDLGKKVNAAAVERLLRVPLN